MGLPGAIVEQDRVDPTQSPLSLSGLTTVRVGRILSSATLRLPDVLDEVFRLVRRPDAPLAGGIADEPPHQGALGQTTLSLGHLHDGGLFRRREQQAQSFRPVHVGSPSPSIPDDCASTLCHILWDSWELLGTAHSSGTRRLT